MWCVSKVILIQFSWRYILKPIPSQLAWTLAYTEYNQLHKLYSLYVAHKHVSRLLMIGIGSLVYV